MPYRTLAGNFVFKPCTKMFSYCFRDSDHKLLIFSQKVVPFVGSMIFVVLGRPRKLLPLLFTLVPHLGVKGHSTVKLPSLLCISRNKDPGLGKSWGKQYVKPLSDKSCASLDTLGNFIPIGISLTRPKSAV